MSDRNRLLPLTAVLLAALTAAGCATTAPQPTEERVESAELRRLATEARERGRTEEALFRYRELLALQPEDTQALLAVGAIQLASGKHRLAEAAFDRLLTLQPDHAAALEGRGECRLHRRALTEARADLERAVAIDDGQWRAWNALGAIADLEGKPSEAQGHYRKALEIFTGHPKVLNNLGYSLLMERRFDEAEAHFREALPHHPDTTLVTNNLAQAIAWQKRYDEAYKLLAPLIGEPQAHNNVGYIALLNGDYPAAIKRFETALQLNPSYYPRAAANLERARRLMNGE